MTLIKYQVRVDVRYNDEDDKACHDSFIIVLTKGQKEKLRKDIIKCLMEAI